MILFEANMFSNQLGKFYYYDYMMHTGNKNQSCSLTHKPRWEKQFIFCDHIHAMHNANKSHQSEAGRSHRSHSEAGSRLFNEAPGISL